MPHTHTACAAAEEQRPATRTAPPRDSARSQRLCPAQDGGQRRQAKRTAPLRAAVAPRGPARPAQPGLEATDRRTTRSVRLRCPKPHNGGAARPQDGGPREPGPAVTARRTRGPLSSQRVRLAASAGFRAPGRSMRAGGGGAPGGSPLPVRPAARTALGQPAPRRSSPLRPPGAPRGSRDTGGGAGSAGRYVTLPPPPPSPRGSFAARSAHAIGREPRAGGATRV